MTRDLTDTTSHPDPPPPKKARTELSTMPADPIPSDPTGTAVPHDVPPESSEVQPEVPPGGNAEASQAAPRVIDENTDMTTLTDQEIMRLMEGMGHAQDAMTKPLISTPVPLKVIRDEYERGSPQVLKKLDWLQEKGWDQVWRARGDGDCFYRSFTLAYLLRILHDPEPELAANLAFDAIQRALPAMQQAGFDPDLYEEFLAPFLELVRSFAPENVEAELPTEWSLVQSLQDPERSNCIVVALRLITSSYIRSHVDLFSPFLLSPTTFLPLTTDDFCRQEVEPCGKEADHAQIMALAEALEIGIRIAYLDRSEVGSGDVINWVEFGKATAEEDKPLTLLYRPGHYDVLAKDVLPTNIPDI